MRNAYFSIIFSVISIFSLYLPAEEGNPTIIEILRPILPNDFYIKQKLSLKDNLSTLFTNLETYTNSADKAIRSDQNPNQSTHWSAPTWSPEMDQRILETLLQNKDKIPSDGETSIINYFTYRLKKISQESPVDVIEHYNGIAKLFPQASFWLPYFENLFFQSHIDWQKLSQLEWTTNVFLPLLAAPNSTTTSWNKQFLINTLSLLNYQYSQILISDASNETNNNTPSKNASTSNPLSKDSLRETRIKNYFQTLDVVNQIFELKDNRFKNITVQDVAEIEISYFSHLQTDFHRLVETMYSSSNQAISTQGLLSIPTFTSTTLETSLMHSLLLTTEKGLRFHFNDNKRVQNFFELHDLMVQFINKDSSQWTDLARLRMTLNAIFYLRTALGIKMISDKTGAAIITKTISKAIDKSNSTLKDLKHSDILFKNQVQRTSETLWYEELIKIHDEFLRLTQMTIYNLSLVDHCYIENLQSPTCNFWRERFPMQLKEYLTDSGEKRKVWEINSKTSLQIPAGNLILSPNQTLIINAPEIHFNMLSRITIPSGQIEIRTNKLTLPWLDTSGKNGTLGVESNGFPGQRPWIKKSEYCITPEYLEGVTFMKTPRKKKVDWVGFSIKNPYPQTIFICSSDAQNKNRDIVGDLDQIIDVGLPPEYVESTQPAHGEPGGKISIEMGASNDKSPITNPLLVSMGGDGSQGLAGHDSPLCNKGKYQSFKIGLSHHKQWFQNWLNHPANQSLMKLISKDEYGDHWYGLFEINIPGSSGSDGGNAALGGELDIQFEGHAQTTLPTRWLLSGGLAGLGGKGGTCGPSLLKNGKDGLPSTLPVSLKVNPIGTH